VATEPDLTGLLQAWSQGNRDALAAFAPLVQHELRAMARRILADERRDRRCRPTELVQESYLRLLDWRGVHWENRAHFFATAARMMRRVLVDAARARRAVKRNAGLDVIPFDEAAIPPTTSSVDVVALEEALEALID
jgi:RNA polymerase sigma factor (TIGR02999 family)